MKVYSSVEENAPSAGKVINDIVFYFQKHFDLGLRSELKQLYSSSVYTTMRNSLFGVIRGFAEYVEKKLLSFKKIAPNFALLIVENLVFIARIESAEVVRKDGPSTTLLLQRMASEIVRDKKSF